MVGNGLFKVKVPENWLKSLLQWNLAKSSWLILEANGVVPGRQDQHLLEVGESSALPWEWAGPF